MLRIIPFVVILSPIIVLFFLFLFTLIEMASFFGTFLMILWMFIIIIFLVGATIIRNKILSNINQDWRYILENSNHYFSLYYILLPIKNEHNIEMLRKTFQSIQSQNYPSDKIILFPILEAEDIKTIEIVRQLVDDFSGKLSIEVIIYPTHNLLRSKATSLTIAGQNIAEKYRQNKSILSEKILVIDADTMLHNQDLAFREHLYRNIGGNYILQSLLINTINYPTIPSLPRIHTLSWIVYQMGLMVFNWEYLILGPGMSVPFEIYQKVEYFEPLRHNEDMMFRYKVLMEGFHVCALIFPTWGMAPWSFRDSWHQIKRWSRGAIDILFIINYTAKNKINKIRKMIMILHVIRSHSIPSLLVIIPIGVLIAWITIYYSYGHYVYNKLMIIDCSIFIFTMLFMFLVIPYVSKPFIHGSKNSILMRLYLDSLIILNIHNFISMTLAALYTQIRIVMGLQISEGEVTKK